MKNELKIDFNAERLAFIEWAARNQYDVSEINNINYGVLFKRHSTENAWMGWLNSAKAKAEELERCVVVPVRSDKEIIDQTIELTDLLATSTNRFQRDPNCLFPFESKNPRVKEWWYVACQIQELLTQTDPNNCDLDEYKADVEAARGGK